METLELFEDQCLIIPENRLDIETAVRLQHDHKKKLSLQYNFFDHSYALRSNGYVGYVPVNDKYVVKINPKVDVKNIFRMLEYAYKVNFELLIGSIFVESTEDLFERLVNVLAKRTLDRNRKGLYSGYVQKTDCLPFLQGRIEPLPTSLSVLKGSTRPTCSYEEHTTDLIENQILLWTIYQVRLFPLKREDVKRVVRKAYRELINKVSLTQIVTEKCINTFYNRLNQDYRPLHGLCRFFLEHLGPGIESGSYEFMPFVIYMPNLFQSFVAEWLNQNMPARYQVRPQVSVNIDKERKFEFIIDLVVKDRFTDKVLCVLDTKYKNSQKPENSDIYQVFTYASKMEANKAFLIYPSIIDPIRTQIRDISIRNLVFDLSKNIDDAGSLFLQELIEDIK